MSDLSFPNSPNFNVKGWSATSAVLERQNAPSRLISAHRLGKVRKSAPPLETKGRKLNSAAIATVRASRLNPKTEVLAKAHDDAIYARLLGLTVKTLRSRAKFAGLVGYSKLRKAELVALLVPLT